MLRSLSGRFSVRGGPGSSRGKGRNLLEAAEVGNAIVLVRLVQNGQVPVNWTDRKGVTALHVAAEHGHLSLCELLLDFRANVNMETKLGITPSMLAAVNGHLEILELFASRGATWSQNEATRCLFEAIKSRYVEIVKFLVTRGADVNFADENGNRPLHFAAKSNRKEMSLVTSFASDSRRRRISKQTRDRETLQRMKICKFLLESGADVDALNNAKESALLRAAGSASVAVVLLAHGADVNLRGGALEDSPLLACAFDPEFVSLMVEHGADINVKNARLQTPLHRAALHEKGEECVEMFLQRGANSDVQDELNRTPLHYAALALNEASIDSLTRLGSSDANAQDIEGLSPIFLAMFAYLHSQNSRKVLRVCLKLIDHGADLKLKTYAGRSLEDFCNGKGIGLFATLNSLIEGESFWLEDSPKRNQDRYEEEIQELRKSLATKSSKSGKKKSKRKKKKKKEKKKNESKRSNKDLGDEGSKTTEKDEAASSVGEFKVSVGDGEEADVKFLLQTLHLEKFWPRLKELGATRIALLKNIDIDSIEMSESERAIFMTAIQGATEAEAEAEGDVGAMQQQEGENDHADGQENEEQT